MIGSSLSYIPPSRIPAYFPTYLTNSSPHNERVISIMLSSYVIFPVIFSSTSISSIQETVRWRKYFRLAQEEISLTDRTEDFLTYT